MYPLDGFENPYKRPYITRATAMKTRMTARHEPNNSITSRTKGLPISHKVRTVFVMQEYLASASQYLQLTPGPREEYLATTFSPPL